MIALRWSEPTRADLEAARARAASDPLSYERVPGRVPDGFVVDHDEREIGVGPAVWERAVDAVLGWAMFDLPWVRMLPGPAPEVCVDVAFASRQLGLWTVHTCRVVELLGDRSGERCGFAYGTLAAHAVRGEESFVLTRDAGERVRFAIHKFSRPNDPLVALAGPVARRLQARFSREAIARIAAAVV